jgi:hypothetical protein
MNEWDEIGKVSDKLDKLQEWAMNSDDDSPMANIKRAQIISLTDKYHEMMD